MRIVAGQFRFMHQRHDTRRCLARGPFTPTGHRAGSAPRSTPLRG